MSFALTVDAMNARTKTRTRRLGWAKAAPGQVVRPIRKGQGLRKGETVEYLACGPIRFTSVCREPLSPILPDDPVREGFPDMTPEEFEAMFCQHNGCTPSTLVTVIDFEFIDQAKAQEK